MGMNLDEMLRETDALTYINALKVTLIEIKEELSQQDELADYFNESRDRVRKLVRKADNNYRLITKLVNKEAPLATAVSVQDETALDELKEVMEDG